jgi:hypothetical protein
MVGRPTIRAVNKIGDIEVKVSVTAVGKLLIFSLLFISESLVSLKSIYVHADVQLL